MHAPKHEASTAPETPDLRRRLILWAPVALLVAYQYYLSAQSSLPGIPIPLTHADKVVHLCYFFLIAACAVRAARFGEGWTRSTTARAVVLGATALGFLDEFHQSFTPLRSVELADVVADAAGATLALFVSEPLWARLDRRFGRGKVAGGQGVEPQ